MSVMLDGRLVAHDTAYEPWHAALMAVRGMLGMPYLWTTGKKRWRRSAYMEQRPTNGHGWRGAKGVVVA